MVSGLRDSPRLDCICHRLHTVFTDAHKETHRQVPEVKKYEVWDNPVHHRDEPMRHRRTTTSLQLAAPLIQDVAEVLIVCLRTYSTTHVQQ